MNIGSVYQGNNKCLFRVWSPWASDIKVKLVDTQKILQLEKDDKDYWTGEFNDIPPGTRYVYRINDGIEHPDPASNFQPEDVHSASEVIDHQEFKWTDKNWDPPPMEDYIIYEIHVGTFTREGTFKSAVEKIPYLKELGVTAVEIMPVSQFPGNRNWGYDGVYLFAPQNSYGGPFGLKEFVNTLHKNKIAVILDVVYNHFGPEGNYLNQYAPYFTSSYRTSWGNAINFDGAYSDEVRNFFIENAIYWFGNFHIDALRLDAVDKIFDYGAKHFLAELSEKVEIYSEKSGLKKILIAESDLNDEKIIRPLSEKGYGIDAQWSDDFHHALHSLITGEREGYYTDFGKIDDLVKSIKQGFVYDGIYSPYRKRSHGNDATERDIKQLIICIQNHDQAGNRACGERISELVSYEIYKLVSSLFMLLPQTPLIFMGQEFYEKAPFLYFVSHSDPELINAVRKGRKEEFAAFKWRDDIPDPFEDKTFMDSRLNWELLSDEKGRVILSFYKKIIYLRKKYAGLRNLSWPDIRINYSEEYKIILVHLPTSPNELFYIVNFEPETITTFANVPQGSWKKILDTSGAEWLGPGTSTEDILIGKEQNITLKRESLVIYESE